MKRFLFWIFVIAAIFGCIYILSLFRPQIEVQIDALSDRFGVDIRESVLTRPIVTIIMTPIMGIPVYKAIFALIQLGGDSVPDDLFGAQVHRLRTGARVLIVVACLGFCGLAAFLGFEALNGQSPLVGRIIAVGCAAICLLMIHILFWAFRYYVKIDQTVVGGHTLKMTKISAPLAGLTRVEPNDQAMEYHLHFETGKLIRVSYYIRGLQSFFDTLDARLEVTHARTSRG